MDVLEETELAQWRLKSSHASLYVMLVLKKLLFVGFLLRDFVSSFYYGVKKREGDNDVLMSQNLISTCNINIFQEMFLFASIDTCLFSLLKNCRGKGILSRYCYLLIRINIYWIQTILFLEWILRKSNTKHIFVCNNFRRQEN